MAKVSTYLNFARNTEEAFNFYKTVFQKQITYIGRYGDVPKTDRKVFEETNDKIMHITLRVSRETVLALTARQPVKNHSSCLKCPH